MALTVVEESDSLTHLQLSGPLNLAAVQGIELRFLALTAARKKPVIIDFANVDFIASMGMRILIEASKSLSREGRKIALFSVQPAVAKVLDAAGMPHVLAIVPDEASARAAVGA